MKGLDTSALALSLLTLSQQAVRHHNATLHGKRPLLVVVIPPHSQEDNHNVLSVVEAMIHQNGLKLHYRFILMDVFSIKFNPNSISNNATDMRPLTDGHTTSTSIFHYLLRSLVTT
jgi:hypothetical protein